ncbi:MAG: 30S ribosomal protein S12 methylthiotransferase RimO [Phycisphaeraceae bacterium]|nr:30S ribosomal protein S12 methylthiotransferase RimO [Phycisphaerales bacterium]MCB9843738.1 30S ribosomal protein S12 methylthiotransferase RimO [Phycisphaeraceae bacterium]
MPEQTPIQTDADIRTVSFVSLGCPKNLVDSEKMLGLLASDGLAPVSHQSGDEDADAIVINTCGFLEASKEESLGVIREAIERKNRGEVKRVVVAGCLVQRHRAKLLEWAPGIDAMIGVFDRDHIVEAVRGMSEARLPIQSDPERPKYWIAANALQAAGDRGIKTIGLTVNGKDGKGLGYFEDDSARLRLTPRHYAYLRISEGCNQNCAFCTIPSIRGKMRSKPLDRIALEAEELLKDGAFELNLIGQDTTSYGDDIGVGYTSDADQWSGGLPLMLRTINDAVAAHARSAGATGGGWVRLMYAYPTNFSDGMIRAIAELEHVVKYIDIPLQHASTRMLGLMRRNVTGEHQLELMHRLRDMIPGIAIRTTLITGFPGESEDDHQQLLEFIEEVGFDALGVFEYSREDGTRAGTMDKDPDLHVPAEVKARRHDEIMQLQQRIAFEQAEFIASAFDPDDARNTGHQFDVLIDRALDSRSRKTPGVTPSRGAEGRLYSGRTYFQAPDIDAVTFVHASAQRAPGDLVRCVIVDSDGYDLIARPIDELA